MNEFQQIFALSMISNMAQELVNDPNVTTIQQAQQAMETQLSTDIPAAYTHFGLSNVSVAWGPSVYINPDDFSSDSSGVTATASNTMVVFNLEINSVNTYVVAIAGTKPTSAFDATIEDGSVKAIVPWAFGTPGNLSPAISTGTSDGVNILISGMTDPATGVLLSDFLTSTTINNAANAVVFTGHSLGGALAPALGLALYGSAATVSPVLVQQAKVYATAGPDVGNKDYVTYFTETFAQAAPAPVAWQQYNRKIWNSLDVVPQAWANLGVIKSIYASNGLNTPYYVDCVINMSLAGLYLDRYSAMDPTFASQFQGTYVAPSSTLGYNCGTCTPAPAKDKGDADLCDFVAEMLYQHIAAYMIEILGITPTTAINPCFIATTLYNKNICGCQIFQ